MEDQLAEIVEYLNQHGIQYILDSGTLLGLIREGKLLPADHDLDFSLPYSEVRKVKKMLPKLEISEDKIYAQTIDGDLYKIFISRYDKNTSIRSVDFKFFKNDSGVYFSPQAYRKKNPYKFEDWSYSFFEMGRKISLQLDEVYAEQNLTRAMDSFPSQYVHVFKTWEIPDTFFDNMERLEIDGVPAQIPSPVEDYLEYRYGDWQREQKNWNFWVDDGGLINEEPFERWTVYD